MTKTILLTGATDGIGLETAKLFAAEGHTLLLHGRSDAKLEQAGNAVSGIDGAGLIETWRADLSDLADVEKLAAAVTEKHQKIDVLLNNAGVFKTPKPRTDAGYDSRFIVNTVAPYYLTKRLLPLMPADGRVINLSSAAQAPVDLAALAGSGQLGDSDAYAQSKLAITMWSFHMANQLGPNAPAIVAVNPASFLASKMVKEAYGASGNDLGIGADILHRAALSDEFASATGTYFDNDRGQFANPHPDAMNGAKNEQLVAAIEEVIATLLN